jgi:hypothetical protein
MEIEVLTVPACPHRGETLARLREALVASGVVDAVVAERVIANPADAVAAGMRGSPTILVDARDLLPAESGEASLSCRLYHSSAGVEGAPGLEALIEALRRADTGEGHE